MRPSQAQHPAGLVLTVSLGDDGEAVQTVLVAATLHARGSLDLLAVIVDGADRARGGALVRRLLDRLGALDVAVGVGSAPGAGAQLGAPAPELVLDDCYAAAAPRLLDDGIALLARLLAAAPPRSLTLVCASSLADVAAAIGADEALAAAKLAQVAVVGGLERSTARASGWCADPAAHADDERASANAVFDFCFEHDVELAVVGREAVGALPLQLARSFAARSRDPLAQYVADAQEASLCALWARVCARAPSLPAGCDRHWFFARHCGLSAEAAEARGLDGLDASPAGLAGLRALLVDGSTRPASLAALAAIVPCLRLLLPAAEPCVRPPHRVYARPRQQLAVVHLLKLLRDAYHDAILLAHDAPARAGGADGAGSDGDGGRAAPPSFAEAARGLWRRATAAAVGVRGDERARGLGAPTLDPTRAERRMRDTGVVGLLAQALGARPSTATTFQLEARGGGGNGAGHGHGGCCGALDSRLDEGTWGSQTGTGSSESWAGPDEILRSLRAGGERDGASASDGPELDDAASLAVDLAHAAADAAADADDAQADSAAARRALSASLHAAMAQAAARQWRLSAPLVGVACALLGGATRAQLLLSQSARWESEVAVTVRSDAYALVSLAGAVALMLALQPTRRFLGLARGAAVAVSALYAYALCASVTVFAARFTAARAAQPAGGESALASLGWEPCLVMPVLAGSLAYVLRALAVHGGSSARLTTALFCVVGVASASEVAGVVARRALLGWLSGGRGRALVVATVARTLLKGGLSVLLLLPRFRACAHAALASTLVFFGAPTQPLAPLAALLGFGSAALAQPDELVDAAQGALALRRLDERGLGRVEELFDPAAAARRDLEALDATSASEDASESPSPSSSSSSSGGGGRRGNDGSHERKGAVVYFVAHARADSIADKAAALARWARAQPSPPTVHVDPCAADGGGGRAGRSEPASVAGGGGGAQEQLALALASLGLCSRLLVLAGPALADSLRTVALVHAWTCLGRSVDEIDVQLVFEHASHDGGRGRRGAGVETAGLALDAAPSSAQLACGRAVLASLDAFAVMYARADDDDAAVGAQLTLAVEIGGACAYNESVRALAPLVHARLVELEAEARRLDPAAGAAKRPSVRSAWLWRADTGGACHERGVEDPDFLVFLSMPGAHAALIAAASSRYTAPTSGPFAPLRFRRSTAGRAAAAAAQVASRLSALAAI